MQQENKTSQYLVNEYNKGTRVFTRFDFSSDINNPEKFKDLDLSSCLFYQCSFHSCEFENVVMKEVVFIECNLKCLVISNSDLSLSKIINCSVEDHLWNNVKTENVTFLLNGHYGAILPSEALGNLRKDFEKAWAEHKK